MYGNLVADPTYFRTKAGTVITQYQIALDRNFRIRDDDPSIRTDWPFVKSYGEQAVEDRMRLKKGSEVYIDGVIQATSINRKTKCCNCGKIYTWKDHTLELVPYDVEYFTHYMTDDELVEKEGKKIEDIRQGIFDFLKKDELDELFDTEDVDLKTVSKS